MVEANEFDALAPGIPKTLYGYPERDFQIIDDAVEFWSRTAASTASKEDTMIKQTLTHQARTITGIAGWILALSFGLSGQTVETIAAGLDNPRGLAFGPEGALYVAEAGPGPYTAGPEGTVCYGPTGAITRIDLRRNVRERVATGLPSSTK